jgi:tight adherence protein B
MTDRLLVIICGTGIATGLLGAVASIRMRSTPVSSDGPTTVAARAIPAAWWRDRLPRLTVAFVAAVLFGLVTGWAVALPIAGVTAYALPRLFSLTAGSGAIAKIEAIATWTEMLQGTLAAAAGLGQAINATSAVSPPPIRAATGRLSAQLNAGIHPRDALLEFADDVADPCADRVVCALLLAATSRAQQLGDLLTSLADSTREEVALRLRIETSRASVRSGVRTVLVFSVVFASGLALLAHSYLAPFGSVRGQAVLALVAVLYGSGLTLMTWLARPPKPTRLLGSAVSER